MKVQGIELPIGSNRVRRVSASPGVICERARGALGPCVLVTSLCTRQGAGIHTSHTRGPSTGMSETHTSDRLCLRSADLAERWAEGSPLHWFGARPCPERSPKAWRSTSDEGASDRARRQHAVKHLRQTRSNAKLTA